MKIVSTFKRGQRKYAKFICPYCNGEGCAREDHLKSNAIVSCGCYLKESARKRMTTHGECGTKIYQVWLNICKDSVCDEWKEFERFKADVGEYPPNKVKHRPDTSKPWCKANFQWVDPEYSASHKRNSRLITWRGEAKTFSQWGKVTGIGAKTIRRRILHLNWTTEKALTWSPAIGRNQHHDKDFYKNALEYHDTDFTRGE